MINETRRARIVLYAVLLSLVLWALMPYSWVIRTSLLSNMDAISLSTPIFPISPDVLTLQSYFNMWGAYDFALFFRNSIVVSLASTSLALLFAIPGSYAFARMDFPGRQALFYTAVFTIMFPWIVITIPVYEIFYRLSLLNTYIGIILALAIFIQPVIIWLLQGFFRQGIPANIEEAALIDGTTEIGAFVRVVLPLSLPAVAATALFAFLSAWNNFLWVFILASDQKYHTATVAVHYALASDILREWNILMAGVVMLILPPIIFYGLAQRYVGEGLGGGV